MRISVQRFNPKTDGSPYFQDYEVPDEFSGRSASDILEYIFENMDPSLAFYSSCVRGLCGACGAVVNGKAGLLCMTRVDGDAKIEPLRGVKIVRDLVTNYKRDKGTLSLQR